MCWPLPRKGVHERLRKDEGVVAKRAQTDLIASVGSPARAADEWLEAAVRRPSEGAHKGRMTRKLSPLELETPS
jgi:hypothetical protein